MSSLRDLLQPIPQSPVHHPEGDVFVHTRMVRRAIDGAVQMLREAKLRGNSSLRMINFDLNPEEYNILRIAAWMHDIGKASATTLNVGGTHIPYSPGLKPFSAFGRWQAIGHEDPEHFKPMMRQLAGTPWEKIWQNMSPEAQRDLFFVIKHHMSLKDDVGFGKSLSTKFVDEKGMYKNDRRIKLLLILLMMDRLGRGIANPIGDAKDGIGGLESGAKIRKDRFDRGADVQSAPAPDDPRVFLQLLRQGGKPDRVVQMAFKGKFGREPSPEELAAM